ncbi:MAG: hypothetical protein KKE79_03610 [Actinobacteria bacterium]|nr:hypothetical protein [Actinomycetota bacterium]MBU4489703.1 hypothetical protein [Actinomycetota bacterium]
MIEAGADMRASTGIGVRAWLVLASFLLGHIVTGEHSPIRLFFMRIFARYMEVPLLYLFHFDISKLVHCLHTG